ncbi:MAG: serine hydrolase [Aestuariivirga sp.]|nr:serine hydrolase [Aestuariivirga sp.]
MKLCLTGLVLVMAVLMAAGVQFPAPAWGDAAMSCGSPLEAAGEWQTASPESAGFDAALLCSLGGKLGNSPEMNVHSVIVVRNAKLVYENYRAGKDQKWGSSLGLAIHTPQTLHDMRSVSKSVVSLLFGIALDRKLVAGIDTPVFSYFPEFAALRSPEKDRIELRHLLVMTSGLAWDERRPYSDPENSERRMTVATNPYRFALEPPVMNPPGEKWNYNGGNTQLLAGVLERSAGMWLTDFAREELFEPLGIKQFEWLKMWSNGEVAAAYGLRLRPRDMAKLGQLVLDKGMWNGRRIVSEAWIGESTQPWTDVEPPLRYGYQWWTDEGEINGRKVSWISAQGLGGQRIYVVPAFGLVVAITAGLYDSASQDWVSFDIFEKFVLAAIRE